MRTRSWGKTPIGIRRRLNILNLVGLALGLWGFLDPWPYGLCLLLLALAPLGAIGLVYLSDGFWTLSGSRHDRRPTLEFLLLFPALAIGYRAFTDAKVLDWMAPFAVACLLAILLASGTYLAERGTRGRELLAALYLVFGFFWGWGVASEANTFADSAIPSTFHSKVLEKSASRAKGGRSYFLQLSAWGPVNESSSVAVSYALFHGTAAGEIVCVNLHKGTLGWRWYTVDRCTESGNR